MRRRYSARGSTLLVVVIVLAVLALAIAAALVISSRERASATAKGRADLLKACGQAASRRIWAEVGNTGGAMTGGVWGVSIPGGPRLDFGHYDQVFTTIDATNITGVKTFQPAGAGVGGNGANLDTTNTFRPNFNGSGGFVFVAHCTDTGGNQYEVELFAKFGIL